MIHLVYNGKTVWGLERDEYHDYGCEMGEGGWGGGGGLSYMTNTMADPFGCNSMTNPLSFGRDHTDFFQTLLFIAEGDMKVVGGAGRVSYPYMLRSCSFVAGRS